MGRRICTVAYLFWAAFWTLRSAHDFYGAMFAQTAGAWSAPLDDVFIHFNFARSTAEGHPFEWVPGNGFSSGNTSILYPFVLALGYALGHVDANLMRWAAMLAALFVFGALVATRHALLQFGASRPSRMHEAAMFLLPPVALSMGGLSWSLWSGMEVALFVGIWAMAFVTYERLANARIALGVAAFRLGLVGLALVLTRPEATGTVACFALFACAAQVRRVGPKRSALLLLLAAGPAALWVVLQAALNRVLTGTASPAGAIVKFAALNPLLGTQEKFDDYTFNLTYTIWRTLERHLADDRVLALALPLLAVVPLAFRSTRRTALLLWCQVVAWLVLVGLNAQVRWQNERYVMPALFWLAALAVLGARALLENRAKYTYANYRGRWFLVGALTLFGSYAVEKAFALSKLAVAAFQETRIPEEWWILGEPLPEHFHGEWIACAVAAAILAWALRAPFGRKAFALLAFAIFFSHQAPVYRDQRWFFGRASKNIRDQHFTSGHILEGLAPKRVLVGDAGALVFVSKRPALDIIGLGGYHGLPFAQAGAHGLAAILELIERTGSDRPDMLAIYPSWWGLLPSWFTKEVVARVPAEGNVICGGYEDVLYRPDWSAMDFDAPVELPTGERVRDAVDGADLVSEAAHAYEFSRPPFSTQPNEATVTTLRSVKGTSRFDGGRRVYPGRNVHFVLRGFDSGHPGHLLLRTAPLGDTHVRVIADTQEIGHFTLHASSDWNQEAIQLPASDPSGPRDVRIEIINDGPAEYVDYHTWLTQ